MIALLAMAAPASTAHVVAAGRWRVVVIAVIPGRSVISSSMIVFVLVIFGMIVAVPSVVCDFVPIILILRIAIALLFFVLIIFAIPVAVGAILLVDAVGYVRLPKTMWYYSATSVVKAGSCGESSAAVPTIVPFVRVVVPWPSALDSSPRGAGPLGLGSSWIVALGYQAQ